MTQVHEKWVSSIGSRAVFGHELKQIFSELIFFESKNYLFVILVIFELVVTPTRPELANESVEWILPKGAHVT